MLASWHTALRRAFDSGDYVNAMRMLPGLVAHARRTAGSGRPYDLAAAADALDLATELLAKVGHVRRARLTAERSWEWSSRTGEPARLAASARCLSIVLRHEDNEDLADELVGRSLRELSASGMREPPRGQGGSTQLMVTAVSSAAAFPAGRRRCRGGVRLLGLACRVVA